MKLSKLFKLSLIFFIPGLMASCAELKEAGRTIGHTTRDVTREIGHGTRDAVKTIGEGTKRVVNSATQDSKDNEDKDEDKDD
ncbi:hypothetical protein [Aliikangiella sp. G2MR2-5]|uniref:hypothetical protein n=1 Tax=Aliikangiella sp. G2MR2-5 TaxID=2788943 RepID=UPI0018AA7D8A|nr:hypothetical protein [Aliikangiella sp. G2MR2-5]